MAEDVRLCIAIRRGGYTSQQSERRLLDRVAAIRKRVV